MAGWMDSGGGVLTSQSIWDSIPDSLQVWWNKKPNHFFRVSICKSEVFEERKSDCPCAQNVLSQPVQCGEMWIKQREETLSSSFVLFDAAASLWDLRCIRSELQHGTNQCIFELSKGLLCFYALENIIFLHIPQCYLLNETWEIFLHAGSKSGLNFAVSFFSEQGLRYFYTCWDFRLGFCFLVTVANSHGPLPQSSVVIVFFLLLLFFVFYSEHSHCHANLEISQWCGSVICY